MNTPITPWIDLMLHQAQRGHHLAWFLYGWFEREQLLNLDALVAWWVRATPAPSRSSGCRSDVDGAPASANRDPARAHGGYRRGVDRPADVHGCDLTHCPWGSARGPASGDSAGLHFEVARRGKGFSWHDTLHAAEDLMNMLGMPSIDLAPLTTQRCYRLDWFLYGWIEREHVLNLNACAA